MLRRMPMRLLLLLMMAPPAARVQRGSGGPEKGGGRRPYVEQSHPLPCTRAPTGFDGCGEGVHTLNRAIHSRAPARPRNHHSRAPACPRVSVGLVGREGASLRRGHCALGIVWRRALDETAWVFAPFWPARPSGDALARAVSERVGGWGSQG
eukprot:scaffold429_cov321-Prasinococcus_capsulatus_cf.AAC.1